MIRTWSPLFRSLREAAAFESTVSVRLLAAPEVDWAGFRVMVRALWSADTTSAVTEAPAEAVAVDEVLVDGLVDVDEVELDGLL